MRPNFLAVKLFLCVLVTVPPCSVDVFTNSDVIDCSPINQEVNGKILWWGNYTEDDSEWYPSEPLCLDENYAIILRKCENGTWSPEPSCVAIQRKFSPCPENFTYHEEKEICYIVLANQTYPPSCPYKNVVSFNDYASLIGNEITGPVWYPAVRGNDTGLYHMFIREPTKYFGNIVNVKYSWKGSLVKHCLISHSYTSYELVYCYSIYNAVCAYKPLGYLKNTYCKKNLGDECFYSDYNLTESKCFCMQDPTGGSCNRLAELKKPYQNFILPANRSDCRIGLEMDDKFLWTNSREKISYSNWNRMTDFSKRYGILTEECSWSLASENESSCILCEESTMFERPQLSLTLDTKNKELVLVVDNPKSLYVPEDSDGIFCFTDASCGSSYQVYTPITYDRYEAINNTRVKYYFSYSVDYPGHYWCDLFTYPDVDMIKTGRLLVYDETIYGNEFVTTIVVEYNSSVDPTLLTYYNGIHEAMHDHLSTPNETLPFDLRWVTITSLDENTFTVEYLVHITSKYMTSVESEYQLLQTLLASAVGKVASIKGINDFRSVSYCLPDTTESNGLTLQWPLTKINSTITPEQFCLHEDGSPVTRTCSGDFLTGAYWSEVVGFCDEDPRQSSITAQLYQLVHSNATLTTKSNYLAEITKDVCEYIPVDIHYIAEILEKSDKEDVSSVENVTIVIDNIISTQKSTLKQSQAILNSTDRILYNFDILLQKFIFMKQQRVKSKYTIEEILTKNLIVYVFDAKQSDVRGVAIYNESDERRVVKLGTNVSYIDLMHVENLEVAAYIPESLIQQIEETLEDNQPLIVIITIFLNDYLFNEHTSCESGDPYKSVFGILLPTIDEEYESSIKIVYNITGPDIEEHCAYWRYGHISDFENTKGQWELQNEPFEGSSIRVCNFEHTTHFALLILADVSLSEQESYAKHDLVLHIITSIGSGFSMFGIFWIFLTAILFKKWRQNKGNQILLHYSAVTLLQLILLYISNDARNSEKSETICICVGVCLHYIVLSQFCWMLVMAVLHYQRFVLVFEKPQQWILLKSCLFGYVIPLVPVIINVFVKSPYNYIVGNTGMCYPTGDGFTLWLLIPVLVIATVNLVFFCVIIWNIFQGKVNDMYGHDFILVLKLRLVAVLSSLLGITWIFGFATEFLSSIICAYLFTITASIQGFIIFLAFIVFNESTRNMYLILFLKTKTKYRRW